MGQLLRLDPSSLWRTGLVICILTAMVGRGNGTGLSAGTGVQCPPPPTIEIVACYPPTRVKRAEMQLAVKPIDLSAAIQRIAGVPLASVITVKRGYPTPGKKVIGLGFFYGVFAGTIETSVPMSPPLPRWVEVDENVGTKPGQSGMHMSQPGSMIGNATPTTPMVMDWSLRDSLPKRRLTVVITTN